ncbi:iron-sulfur cluster co-chaperone HscB C-terminal domain-containing protein [Imhoffiella purpurea]|uniref:Chaperone protein HscB n=1 Tax=Imhoffiella purpurea TaxID=1249627 RepID=W9V143_9GAMM|nr:iron-sulfur cluster co-chaperone HscB C-terminal domain-containing protein [Imhoffiella purpurea]EXJ13203.1 Chaperone protein HscB [Imhoffiella purpurea]
MLNSAKNYFELFDLPMSFAIDASLLAERYRALLRSAQRICYGVDNDVDSAGNVQALNQVEEAYRTLTDPLARAEYLFSLYPEGGSADSGRAEIPGSQGASLMERMELQEILAEATNRSDPATAVAEVLTQLAERCAALDKELHALLADPCPSNLQAAREIVRQLQFLGRCRRDAEYRRMELGIRD